VPPELLDPLAAVEVLEDAGALALLLLLLLDDPQPAATTAASPTPSTARSL
jgi:hypothetical protein